MIGSQLVSANIPPPAFDWVSRILLKNLQTHHKWKRRSARAWTTGYRSVRETVHCRKLFDVWEGRLLSLARTPTQKSSTLYSNHPTCFISYRFASMLRTCRGVQAVLLSRLCQLVRGHPEGERLGAVAAFLCFCFSFLSSCRPALLAPNPKSSRLCSPLR